MNDRKTISDKGLDIIKRFEGFVPNAYDDVTGHPTIGYGTLIDTTEEAWLLNTTISRDQGEALLRGHLQKKVYPYIRDHVSRRLNQNQFDALSSFIYNVGGEAFKDSTLLERINRDAPEEDVREAFRMWNKSNGQVIEHLKERREEEASLFFFNPVIAWIRRNLDWLGMILIAVLFFLWYRKRFL